MTADIKHRLKEFKPQLLHLLQDPMASAHLRLREVTDEVSAVWDGLKVQGMKPPWMDPDVEAKLDQTIDNHFHAGDIAGALKAIEAWRNAWLDLLQPAHNSGGSE